MLEFLVPFKNSLMAIGIVVLAIGIGYFSVISAQRGKIGAKKRKVWTKKGYGIAFRVILVGAAFITLTFFIP